MNDGKKIGMTLAALLIWVACSASVYAELNAGDLADTFNSMNGNTGFRLRLEFQSPGAWRPDIGAYAKLTTLSGDSVDTGAYGANRSGTTGQHYFFSFCITPSVRNMPGTGNYIGKLNYTDGLTKNRDGIALSVGAAFLYKEFAADSGLGAGNLDWNLFAEAMYFLNHDPNRLNPATGWDNNHYLRSLRDNYSHHLGIGESWTDQYDPGRYYGDWFGEYSVFVMTLANADGTPGTFQDFLYIANATRTSDVPEPATLLLWTLGGLGLFGASKSRRRRMKKLAVS